MKQGVELARREIDKFDQNWATVGVFGVLGDSEEPLLSNIGWRFLVQEGMAWYEWHHISPDGEWRKSKEKGSISRIHVRLESTDAQKESGQ